MTANCFILREPEKFEKEVFDYACKTFSNDFTVLSPFLLDAGREFDGLIIGPRCIFTIESKSVQGHVEKGLNSDLVFRDQTGKAIILPGKEKNLCPSRKTAEAFHEFLRKDFHCKNPCKGHSRCEEWINV